MDGPISARPVFHKNGQRIDYSAIDASPFAPYVGCRVEVTFNNGADPERFWVGKSTGWKPALLAVKTTRSMGGEIVPDASFVDSIKVIRYASEVNTKW
jgi:hypothetical protein